MKKTMLITLQLFFIGQVAVAQDFITTWDVSNFSNMPEIRFVAQTVGSVTYSWQTIAPAVPASGSGTFVNGNVLLTFPGLTANVRLSIQPQNFRRFTLPDIPFWQSSGLLTISQWGSTQWISMENAFKQSGIQVTATDVPNLSLCTSLASMFEGCYQLNSPFNVNSWNVSNITNMSKMFSGCFNFNQALSLWNTTNVTNMSSMFEGCRSFNLNIGNWNTGNVTNMSKMFKDATAFNRNIGSWNTINVTNMSEMFDNTNNGFQTTFNQNIGNWNTSNVSDMSGMFREAVNFNQNISNWNTGNVINMFEMFRNARNFNQNIGSWNVGNVTNSSNMFFNGLDLGSNQLNYAFNNGGNNSIQNWNTGNVTNMSGMFTRANNFNQNLGNWALNPAVNLTNMLNSSGLNCTNYSATIMGWSANPNTPNNKILGATFMEFGPEAQSAVNNLTLNKGWGFSGHDIIVNNPTFTVPSSVCQNLVAPVLPATSSNSISGTWLPAVINNQSNGSYTFTPTTGQCASPVVLNISVAPLVLPSAIATQTLNSGSTIANIAVNPSNVLWYATLSNANANTNQLASNVVLVNGATYYAVNDNGQCRSQPFAVTVSISLGATTFDLASLKLYPNPVADILQISYKQSITSVEIYSILGQKLLSTKPNANAFSINVSDLPQALYLIKIKSDNQIGELKFLKQ